MTFCYEGDDINEVFVDGDFGICFENLFFAITSGTILLIFGTVYLLRIRRFRLQGAPEHTANCEKYPLNTDRQLSDILLFLSCIAVSLISLFSLLGRKIWPSSLGKLYPFETFFFICQTGCWSYAAFLVWVKSAPQRQLPSTFTLRIFLVWSLICATIKLRTVMRIAMFHDDDAAIPKLGWDFPFISYVCSFFFYFLAGFIGVCFRGGSLWSMRGWSNRSLRRRLIASDRLNDTHLQDLTTSLLPEDTTTSSPFGLDFGADAFDPENDANESSCPGCRAAALESPEANASLLSKLTFWWMNPLMKRGNIKQLDFEDLDQLDKGDMSAAVNHMYRQKVEKLKATGDDETAAAPPSLTRKLFATWGARFIFAGVLKGCYDAMTFVGPAMLKAIIGFLHSDGSSPWYYGYIYTGVLFGTALCQSVTLHQYFHSCFRMGMQMRTMLVTEVYQKSLVLTTSARTKQTTGEIVNLMSTDAQRLQDLFPYVHIAWSGPFQIILSIYFLWQELGPSVLVGVGVMVGLMLPANTVLARWVKKTQKKLMSIKDERVKVTNETFSSLKVIKLYAWEESFGAKIADIREREIACLKDYLKFTVSLRILWNVLPVLVSVSTFATYSLSGHNLTAAKAFTSLALFNILRFPMAMFPRVVNNLIEAKVSVERLSDYLDSNELKPIPTYCPEHDDERKEGGVRSNECDCVQPTGVVHVHKGTFYWDDACANRALSDIELTFQPGSLNIVIGEVGAGKSAFLNALIGELTPEAVTKMTLQGSVAYAAQSAWIRNATVRDNILFGAPYDPDWYNQVVHACALTPDFEMLKAKDMTEIGAKGINLSGGQKQRVALARAVYQRCDIYLLDDTLSAVDVEVGTHIFQNAILGLLKDKTVVLITHNSNTLSAADTITQIETGGTVAFHGSYDEFQQRGEPDCLQCLDDTDNKDESEEVREEETTGGAIDKFRDKLGALARQTQDIDEDKNEDKSEEKKSPIAEDEDSHANDSDTNLLKNKAVSSDDQKASDKKKGELIDDEKRAAGHVKWKVYEDYIKAGGGYGFFVVILGALFLSTSSSVLTDRWLAYWSSHGDDQDETNRNLMIYALCSLGKIFFLGLSLITLVIGGLNASVKIHNDLLHSMLRVPMYILDITPIGRILNRFSKDLYTIDESLPATISSYLQTSFTIMSTVILISVISPYFMIALLPVGGIFYWTQTYYIATQRELKRWDSVLRSPIYSLFTETLEGSTSIRAFGLDKAFIHENTSQLDKSLRAYYPGIAANRWLAMRNETIGTLITTVTALTVVASRNSIDAGLGALAISYSLSITQSLNWMVRMTSQRETNVVSVERITEYCQFPEEAPLRIPGREPDASWPDQGAIDFNHLTLRYQEGMDLVLKGITASIGPAEKIGVVGRTGAGKSSLLLALMRLVELSPGQISIDGEDIREIGLFDLRSRIAIIPQDPVVFLGTIRFNLDPFDEIKDDQVIWEALKHSHLYDHVKSLEDDELTDGLQYELKEGGGNFSMGQRQLLCLARALLRKPKILLLDEATSAIDHDTDQLVQQTIKSEFADSTTLTIAHRLDTILESTKVMVLDKGLIVEYDTPENLLNTPNSIFFSIIKKSGLLPDDL